MFTLNIRIFDITPLLMERTFKISEIDSMLKKYKYYFFRSTITCVFEVLPEHKNTYAAKVFGNTWFNHLSLHF